MEVSELSTREGEAASKRPSMPASSGRSALEALMGDEDISEEEQKTRLVKERCNIMLVIAYLYVFKVVHPSMVFDLVGLLIDRLNEVRAL